MAEQAQRRVREDRPTLVEFFGPYADRLGQRRDTFERVVFELQSRRHPFIIETGCVRNVSNWGGDGCSSILFADFVSQYDGKLISIDIDEDICRRCRNATQRFEADHVVICGDSVTALKQLAFFATSKKIDLLYLDSYDWDKEHEVECQTHALKEAQAIQHLVAQDGFILVDDVALPGQGKGGMVIPWLTHNGWHEVMRKYQVLLARESRVTGE